MEQGNLWKQKHQHICFLPPLLLLHMLQMLCGLLAKETHECEGKVGDVWTPNAGGGKIKKSNTMINTEFIFKNSIYE